MSDTKETKQPLGDKGHDGDETRGNNKSNGNSKNRQDSKPKRGKFEGRIDELKGHVYDYTGRKNPEMYIKVTKEVAIYFGRQEGDYSGDFVTAINDLDLTDPPEPQLAANAGFQDQERWKLAIKEHHNKTKAYSTFRSRLYYVIMAQCTTQLEQQIRSHDDFAGANNNGIELLRIIRSITHSPQGTRHKLADSLADMQYTYFTLKQGKQPLDQYHDKFKAQVDSMRDAGIPFSSPPHIREVATRRGRLPNEDPTDEDREAAEEESIAIQFVRGSRYTAYKRHLRNDILEGNDIYPTTMHEAYTILQRRDDDQKQGGKNNDHLEGFAMTTVGTASNGMVEIVLMELERHGRMSSSKRTKHIDLRYFHVTDRCKSGDITVEHCPTDVMRADFFTKPLQGNLFRKMRDTIMNIPTDCKYHSSCMQVKRSVLEGDNVLDTTTVSTIVQMDKLTGPGQTPQPTDNTGYHITQNTRK